MAISVKCSHKEMVPINQLVPHPQNSNTHPQKQIDLLAKLIKFQGFRNPIVVSNLSGYIVAGHGRLEAAKILDMDSVPVDYQDFDNKPQEIAYLESDNLVADLADHKIENLHENIRSLDLDDDFDLELFGVPDLLLGDDDLQLNEDLDDFTEKEKERKYIIQVEFPNDMEMRDYHDDLISRGYLVKVLFDG